MALSDKILFSGSTELEIYQVIETIYEGRQARVLYSGEHRTAQSGLALDDNPDLLFDYNQRFVELLECLSAKRLLLIGGGAYTLPIALLTRFPDLSIDVVEHDTGLQAIANRYFGLRPNSQLHIYHQEGSAFLAHNKNSYDVILIDAFCGTEMSLTLTSVAAVKLIARNVGNNGLVAVNIISPYFGLNNQLIDSQVKRYSQNFNKVEVYPAGRAIFSLWLAQNLVLVAQKGIGRNIKMRYEQLPPLADQ